MDHPKIRTDRAGDLLLNFDDYGEEVDVACFSADGRRVLTVQEVGVARVWDVDTGRPVGEIRPTSPLAGRREAAPTGGPFEVFIEAAALDPSGQVALLGLNDGTAGLFSVADGSRRATFHHPDRPPATGWELIRAVDFSPDGSLAVVGFYGRCVGMWDVSAGRPVAFLRSGLADGLVTGASGWARDTLVSSVGVSADNRHVFAGHGDGTAPLWDLAGGGGEVVFDATEHAEEVVGLWHGDHGAVRWATTRGTVWESAAAEAAGGDTAVRRLATGADWVEVAFAPDGTSLIARDRQGRVTRWDLGSGAAADVLVEAVDPDGLGRSSSVRSVGFAPGGQAWVYPAAADRLALATPSGAKADLPCPVRAVRTAFAPDGRMLAAWGDGRLRVWAIPSGEPVGEWDDPGTFWSAAFSPDGSLLAAGTLGQVTADGLGPARTVSLWTLADRGLVCRWPAHDHQVHGLAFTPDGGHLVSSSLDRSVRLWRLPHGRGGQGPVEVRRLTYDDLIHEHLRVLADGRTLVFRRDGIEVWRGLLADKAAEVPAGVGFRTRWAVSPDGRSLVLDRGRQSVEVWSLDTGRPLARHAADIRRPQVVPGPWLPPGFEPVAGCYLWGVPTGSGGGGGGHFAHTLDGPRGWATPLRVSGEGRRHLVLPGHDRIALVDLEPAPRVAAEFPFEGRMRASCVTAERVLAVNAAGRVYTAPRPR